MRSEEQDELLRSLVSGERSPADDDVQRALRESDELRARWEDMKRIRDMLEAEDHEREAVLADSAHPIAEVDEERTLAGFRRIARGGTLERPGLAVGDGADRPLQGSRRWRALIAIAAAAVLLLVIWAPWNWHSRHGVGPQLGERDVVKLVHPVGEVTSYDPFRWHAPPVPAAGYRLRIFERKPSGEVVPIKTYSTIKDTEFLTELELPDSIEWEVLAVDDRDSIVAKGSATARRLR